MVKNKMRPIHPGEILREEFLVGATTQSLTDGCNFFDKIKA